MEPDVYRFAGEDTILCFPYDVACMGRSTRTEDILAELDELLADSSLTEYDVEELADLIDAGVSRRLHSDVPHPEE